MWTWFRRVCRRGSHCGGSWRIPVRRLHGLERFLSLKPTQPLIWECHECHEGVVVPENYQNVHGEQVCIDVDHLDPDTQVFRF